VVCGLLGILRGAMEISGSWFSVGLLEIGRIAIAVEATGRSSLGFFSLVAFSSSCFGFPVSVGGFGGLVVVTFSTDTFHGV